MNTKAMGFAGLTVAAVLLAGCHSSSVPATAAQPGAIDVPAESSDAQAEFERVRQLEQGCCEATS